VTIHSFTLRGFFLPLVSVTFLALSLGCQNSSDSRTLEDSNNFTQFASCEFEFTEGEPAVFNYSQGGNLVTAAFGKQYDERIYAGVARASGKGTVDYFKALGLDIYKHSDQDETNSNNQVKCPFFKSLPTLPSSFSETIKIFMPDPETNSMVLGLYYSPGTARDADNQAPIIVLRQATDRYTLLHEGMHHLFSAQRQEDTGVSDKELKALLEKSLRLHLALERNHAQKSTGAKQASAEAIAANFKTLFESYLELMLRFTLEEIAIESKMAADFETGKLATVSRSSYVNGMYYVGLNKEDLATKLALIDTLYAESLPVLGEHSAPLRTVYHRVNARRLALETEAAQLAKAALAKIDKEKQSGSFGLAVTKGDIGLEGENHKGCAHQKELEEFIDSLNQLEGGH
jgi:hypothetical protein